MGNGSRFRALALLIMVLLAGVVVGWFAHDQARHSRRSKQHGSERLIHRMTDDLGLNATQQDSVRTILDRRRVDIDSLWADAHPRFEAIRSLTNAQIETLLTPAQREKFREGELKREARRREHGRAKAPR